MTHYHLYINAGALVDETSVVYKVGIGTSKQANQDYLFLTAYAVEHGHYFALWSNESVEFLLRIQQSVAPVELYPRLISARDLVRQFKTQLANPLDQSALHDRHKFRMQTSLNYRITSILAKRT